MSAESPALPDVVASFQALHYDVRGRRITLMPAPEIERILQHSRQPANGGFVMSFDAVSDLAISSRDTTVVGECREFRISEDGDRQRCEMSLADFGENVSVRFSFSRVQLVPCRRRTKTGEESRSDVGLQRLAAGRNSRRR